MVRVKNRYLVVKLLYPVAPTRPSAGDELPDLVQFHAPTPDTFHPGQLLRVVRDAVADLFGDYGVAMVNSALKVNYWSAPTSTAIIRCPREHYRMLWAALTTITRLPKPTDTPVVARVLRVSGTIKKAEEEVIKRAKLIVRRAKAATSGPDQAVVQAAVKSVEKSRTKETSVLAAIDQDDESESGSESDD